MTLFANASGVLSGKFLIPAGIPAGAKTVRAATASGAAAVAGFTGRGRITTEQRRNVTTVTENWFFFGVDPLAQTFTLSSL